MGNESLPKLAVGQVWKRRDGTTTKLAIVTGAPGHFFCGDQWSFSDGAAMGNHYAVFPGSEHCHDLMELSRQDECPHTEAAKHAGYVTKDSGKRVEFATGSRRDTTEGKGSFVSLSPHMLRRVAELMERGALKYGLFNYEKGQPFSRVLDSLMRHTNQIRLGDTTEDHASAAVFNAMALIHFQEEIKAGRMDPALNDLPRYDSSTMSKAP